MTMEEEWSFLAWSETDCADSETGIRTPRIRVARMRVIFSPETSGDKSSRKALASGEWRVASDKWGERGNRRLVDTWTGFRRQQARSRAGYSYVSARCRGLRHHRFRSVRGRIFLQNVRGESSSSRVRKEFPNRPPVFPIPRRIGH